MWIVKDIYPSKSQPGWIAVDYWNEEEPLNCRLQTKLYRDASEVQEMIPPELDMLRVCSDAKRKLEPVCEELKAEFCHQAVADVSC